MSTNTNNAREFLEYIAKNEKRLKRNLRKNITYDAELFDDIYQTTIVKVYDSITKNNLHVEDFEKYFFICSKFNYINADNKKRRLRNITVDESSAHDVCDEEYEDTSEETERRLKEIEDYLRATYGNQKTDIFLDYHWQYVRTKHTSYVQIGEKHNLPVNAVAKIIKDLKSDLDNQNKNIKINTLF